MPPPSTDEELLRVDGGHRRTIEPKFQEGGQHQAVQSALKFLSRNLLCLREGDFAFFGSFEGEVS